MNGILVFCIHETNQIRLLLRLGVIRCWPRAVNSAMMFSSSICATVLEGRTWTDLRDALTPRPLLHFGGSQALPDIGSKSILASLHTSQSTPNFHKENRSHKILKVKPVTDHFSQQASVL